MRKLVGIMSYGEGIWRLHDHGNLQITFTTPLFLEEDPPDAEIWLQLMERVGHDGTPERGSYLLSTPEPEISFGRRIYEVSPIIGFWQQDGHFVVEEHPRHMASTICGALVRRSRFVPDSSDSLQRCRECDTTLQKFLEAERWSRA